MRAMVLYESGQPLLYEEVRRPEPKPGQVLIKVHACGVCRTDLHVVDGELPHPALPLIQCHQIVGTVVETGTAVTSLHAGQRIGVPWLGYTCGVCRYCMSGHENLCDNARFTGYDFDGGFAEYAVADARYCFSIPGDYPDVEAAPLLCAGLIGYRSLRMAGEAGVAPRIGLYGFGAAAHIIVQVARFQGREVYAFTRTGDVAGQDYARSLGAVWSGSSSELPPVLLDAAIIFAPTGELVPAALRATAKGGSVVCAGIHMSDIPAFPYEILWGERQLRSVANLTRRDGEEFLQLAPEIPIHTDVRRYRLADANQALDDLRHGRFRGAAVLEVSGG
jgi:propanol-preferring alcohol dehydrogenase